MRYLIRSGILSIAEDGKTLAQIKSAFWGAKKTISLSDNGNEYYTDIDLINGSERSGDVRLRTYRLKSSENEVLCCLY